MLVTSLIPTQPLTRAAYAVGKLPQSRFDKYLDQHIPFVSQCVSKGLPKLGVQVLFADVPHKAKNKLYLQIATVVGYVPHAFDAKEVLVYVTLEDDTTLPASLRWLTLADTGDWLCDLYQTTTYYKPRRRNRRLCQV